MGRKRVSTKHKVTDFFSYICTCEKIETNKKRTNNYFFKVGFFKGHIKERVFLVGYRLAFTMIITYTERIISIDSIIIFSP